LAQIPPLFFCRKTGSLVAWIQVRSIVAKIRGKKGPAHDHAAFFLFFEN
jgi:hypothetical protein